MVKYKCPLCGLKLPPKGGACVRCGEKMDSMNDNNLEDLASIFGEIPDADIKDLEEQQKILDEVGDYDDDDEFNAEDLFLDSDEERKLKDKPKPTKKKIELDPWIDPKTLACRDTLQYMHLLVGSRTLPSSGGDGQDFGFSARGRTKRETNKKDERFYDVKDIICNLDMESAEFGLKGSCNRKNYAVLSKETIAMNRDLAGCVLKGIPVKSPLFLYKIQMSRRTDSDERFFGKNVWEVTNCKLLKQPLDLKKLSFLVYHVIGLSADDGPIFERNLFALHPELKQGQAIDFTWKDYVKCIQGVPPIGLKLNDRPVPELIRYIYCNKIEYLTQFYKERIILNMIPSQIDSLYDKINSDPFELFFFKMTTYTFRVGKKIREKKKKVAEPAEPAVEVQLDEQETEDEEVDDEDANMREFLEQLTFNRDIVHKSYMCYLMKLEMFWLFLPELNSKCIDALPPGLLTPRQVSTIRIYTRLKESYQRDFNDFEYKWGLMAEMSMELPLNIHDDEFNKIMKWLCEEPMRNSSNHSKYSGYVYTLVKQTRSAYYIRESHLHNMCIVEGFRLLFDRFSQHTSLDKDSMEAEEDLRAALGPEAEEFLGLNPKHYIPAAEPNITTDILSGMCSEQVKALYLHRDSPIINVNGGGGSGKTFLMRKIMQCYPPGEVLACAFQGRNVATLSSVFNGFAFTCHMLLYMHKKACATDSWSTSNAWRKKDQGVKDFSEVHVCNGIHYKRCPFEKIKVLVIDELSLMSNELFATVLSVFLRCAVLSKIVLCGDPNQLPPLGSGYIIKEVREFCNKMGLTVEFKHNHRVSKESELLHENALAIANRKPHDFLFDDETCLLEHFSAGYIEKPTFAYGAVIAQVVEKYQLPMENTVVLCRANIVKDSVNPVLDKLYMGKACDEHTWLRDNYIIFPRSKIVFKKNLYLKDNVLINNELLYVIRIEDYKEVERKVGKDKVVIDIVDITEVEHSHARKAFRGALRRIVVKSLDHQGEERIKYIPFIGINRKKVLKAYAQTIHGAQGGEWDNVILFMPYFSQSWTTESVYTAFTRAKKRFILVADLKTFHSAISTPEKARLTETGELCIAAAGSRIPEGWANWKNPDYYEDLLWLENADLDDQPIELGVNHISIVLGIIEAMAIVSFDNLKHVFKLRRVCKQFKELIDSKEVWTRIYYAMYRKTYIHYKIGYMLSTSDLHSDNYDLMRTANVVVNSIGTGVYTCNSGCKYGHLYISPASIIAVLKRTQASKKPLELEPLEGKKPVEMVSVRLTVCPCGASADCFIQFKKVATVPPGEYNHCGYLPASATLHIPNPKKAKFNRIDTSALKEAHPSKLEERRKIILEEVKKKLAMKRSTPAIDMNLVKKAMTDFNKLVETVDIDL